MIRLKVSTVDRDKNWKRFLEDMKKVDGAHVSVGVHEDAGAYTKAGSPSVAQVAFWNEFGTENMPERSFIRSSYDQHESELNQLREELMSDLKAGKTSVAKALETLGFRYQAMIQNKITSGVAPANTPSTLRAKAKAGVGSTTLNWTKLMFRSIGYKVRMK